MLTLRSRTVGALVAASFLLTTGCQAGEPGADSTDVPGIVYLNAPEELELPGTRVTLTHETGLTYTTTIDAGVARPPVLWDGDWTIETDSGHRETIHVGAVDTDGDLRACIQADAGAQGEDIRCAQGVMTGIALTAGYTAGEQEFREAAAASKDDIRWGRYCHLSAMTVAAAAVLGGEDPRRIMDEHESPCEYSTYHGAAAGAVMLAGDNSARIVEALCTPNPENTSVPFSQGTQCWHGVGIGLAYLHRFDPEPGVSICMLAPDVAWAGNCIEGLFAAYREYLKRLDEGQWPTTTGTAERCHDLYRRVESPQFADTCYKDVAQRFAARHHGTPAEFTAALETGLEAFAAVCKDAIDTDEHLACWNGIAVHLATGIFLAIGEHRDDVARLLTLCDESGTDVDNDKCYTRAGQALIQHPQKPAGLPLEEILDLMPAERHGAVTAGIEDWMTDHYGRRP